MTNPFGILTGCPYEVYDLRKQGADEFNIERIEEAQDKKYLLSLRVASNHEICEEHPENMWYEFYVLRVEKVEEELLFQIQNHWEEFEWTGRWSSESD